MSDQELALKAVEFIISNNNELKNGHIDNYMLRVKNIYDFLKLQHPILEADIYSHYKTT